MIRRNRIRIISACTRSLREASVTPWLRRAIFFASCARHTSRSFRSTSPIRDVSLIPCPLRKSPIESRVIPSRDRRAAMWSQCSSYWPIPSLVIRASATSSLHCTGVVVLYSADSRKFVSMARSSPAFQAYLMRRKALSSAGGQSVTIIARAPPFCEQRI